MRKKDRGQKEGRRASSRSNVDDVGSPTTVRPGPLCACRHRWLQTPTVREGNDPGRRAFYPLPKRPAVSRADTLSGGECSTTKTLRAWLRGWPGPPPPRGLSSPVRQPQRERRRVGAGGDRLALAAIQWKVRLGRRAASGAATHHVMQKLQMSLLGGPSPEPGLPTLLMWGPTPPPRLSHGRRCVGATRMREPLQPGGGENTPFHPPTRQAYAGSDIRHASHE